MGYRLYRHRRMREMAIGACLGAAIMPAAITSAWAQVPPGNPGAAIPQGSPLPRLAPAEPPTVRPGPLFPTPSAPQETAPAIPVAVRSVVVEGVSVYPVAEFTRLAGNLTGPAVLLTQIDVVRQEILRRYRDDGYVLTAVTATIDPQAVLHFRVTEGRIAEVRLDGDIGPAGTQVLRFLNRLTVPKAIDAATLERYLLLAQDVPGITVHAVLRPSTDEPGALTLIAQVSRKPWNFLATADNRAFKQTGPEQSLFVMDLNSFTEFGERTELSLYRTFNSTQIFGQASVEAFLGGSGLKLKVYAGSGDATPSGDLRAVGYNAQTHVFGTQLTYPIIRARQQTLNVFGAFDAVESNVDENTGVNGASARASYDSLRVLRAGTEYAMSDLWLGGERPAVNNITVRLSKGLSALGATSINNPLPARQNEQPNFFKMNFDISRTQTLLSPWDGASVALEGIVSGQMSPDILPPAEQYFLGGDRITRGYYSGEVVGDKALATTAELQLNTSYELAVFGTTLNIAAQFYGFYDWGQVWQNQKTDPDHHLQSVGGGVRMNVTQYTEIDLEGVKRLNRFPNGSATGVSPLPGEAFYWRVLTRF